MRGRILRITTVFMVGLAAGAGWLGVGASPQVGEVVPDNQAAALRGGDCLPYSKTTCVNGVKEDQFGRDCTMKAVLDYDQNGSTKYDVSQTKNFVYCGGTQLSCSTYADPNNPPPKCGSSSGM